MTPEEFLQFRDASSSLKLWFDSLIEAGFNERQAIAIITGTISGYKGGEEGDGSDRQ
jgi:hypothetical protein